MFRHVASKYVPTTGLLNKGLRVPNLITNRLVSPTTPAIEKEGVVVRLYPHPLPTVALNLSCKEQHRVLLEAPAWELFQDATLCMMQYP